MQNKPKTQLPNQAGYLRVSQILKVFPVSKSTWWDGCKLGRYPASIKLSPRVTVWRVRDIQALLDSVSEGK